MDFAPASSPCSIAQDEQGNALGNDPPYRTLPYRLAVTLDDGSQKSWLRPQKGANGRFCGVKVMKVTTPRLRGVGGDSVTLAQAARRRRRLLRGLVLDQREDETRPRH
jgi:hypothetical protein